ncbi:DUF3658 domain-containing protein [Methylobacterium sp. J-068]|uniref:DUF3658 domain-containing protein n=1 Tax=Methylobacterium sp. J-068 TaxID=2836649 RepID=UPI001FB90CCC|nr:DUF3658 domain-containing protein [Methylobacterium sp. J-068]MCJ2033831.1 DUF1835 domain-containing protein [Methylobacterium sp. J-068]
MTETSEVVHVAWGVSRAESVRDALRSEGCTERVIALSSALHVGPIDHLHSGARRAWAHANLRDDDPDWDWHEPEAPWTEATSPAVYPVYWVCLSDAGEHASYLAFASRMAGRPFDIVDATGLDVTTVGGVSPVWSLGLLRPEDIVASGLQAKRRTVSTAEGEAASAAWSRLRRENAPLRVVRDGRLMSAPLTHFDPVLTGLATPGWELVIKLIGRAINHLNSEVDPPGQGTGDELLFTRVLALGQAGALEVRGAGPGMRAFEVRLPASPVSP